MPHALALSLGVLVACAGLRPGAAGDATPRADSAAGVQLVESASVRGFYERALGFYGRLARRRFDTRDTYRDERLREFFRAEAAFADYYADLADALSEAHFERSRPLALEVLEFAFDAPEVVQVRVRLVGEDARPLRPGETELERVDRWERIDGAWWIVPGKL